MDRKLKTMKSLSRAAGVMSCLATDSLYVVKASIWSCKERKRRREMVRKVSRKANTSAHIPHSNGWMAVQFQI